MTDPQIEQAISKLWTGLTKRPSDEGFHHHLRDAIVALGNASGFDSKSEHRVAPVYPHHKNSYIDVVWKDKKAADLQIPRLLIEIDDSSNPRAIRKLLENPAQWKIWLCYGPENRFRLALERHAGTRAGELALMVMPLP